MKTIQLNVYVSPAMREALRRAAFEAGPGSSMSALAVEAIRAYPPVAKYLEEGEGDE